MIPRVASRIVRTLLGLVATVALAATVAPKDVEAQSKHRMRIVHAYPEHTQHGRNIAFFKEKVEAYTDGRVEVTIYPNAELGAITQEVSMVLAGTVDASYNIGGVVEATDPV